MGQGVQGAWEEREILTILSAGLPAQNGIKTMSDYFDWSSCIKKFPHLNCSVFSYRGIIVDWCGITQVFLETYSIHVCLCACTYRYSTETTSASAIISWVKEAEFQSSSSEDLIHWKLPMLCFKLQTSKRKTGFAYFISNQPEMLLEIKECRSPFNIKGIFLSLFTRLIFISYIYALLGPFPPKLECKFPI